MAHSPVPSTLTQKRGGGLRHYVGMTLSIGERTVDKQTCDECGRPYDHVTGFVYDDGDAHSIYYASCHGHPEHEAWIDVVLGTWWADDVDDHVTFSCRLRAQGATAVDASVAVKGEAEFFGKKLSRDEALGHPLVDSFWSVVDLLAAEDDSVVDHLGLQAGLRAIGTWERRRTPTATRTTAT
jgi:hypothetical protein